MHGRACTHLTCACAPVRQQQQQTHGTPALGLAESSKKERKRENQLQDTLRCSPQILHMPLLLLTNPLTHSHTTPREEQSPTSPPRQGPTCQCTWSAGCWPRAAAPSASCGTCRA